MEIKIGIEMRDEYKRLEVAKGAMKFVRDFMLIQPGENVVVNYDTLIDERVVHAIADAIYALDATPVIIYHPTAEKFYGEPPAPIAGAIARATCWIEMAYAPFMHSAAYREAVDKNGSRYICATGMDTEMLTNLIGKVNIDKVIELGEYFKAKLQSSRHIRVTGANGTDLKGDMGGRKVRHSGIKASQKGYPVMLPGQTSWCPIEESINGVLVFDGAIFPPEEIGGPLSSPVILHFKEGRVVGFEGTGQEAKMFKEWIESFKDPNMYRMAHFSQGFNPGVTKITGRIVEDERYFGGMEFGIGSQGVTVGGAHWAAASHTDGVLLKPSIELDGEMLEQDGVYQDPTARAICAELGVAGY